MAIAFDTNTDLGINGGTGTSFSWSHTTGGSNRFLLVAVSGGTGADNNPSITYAGTAMTKVGGVQATGGRWCYLFFLRNPATGANTVAVTFATSVDAAFGCSASYTGAVQSGAIDASGTNSATTGTSYTESLTPVADKCWVAFGVRNSDGTVPAAGAGTTLRASDGRLKIFDNNAAISPAASTTLTVTNDTSTNWGSAMCSIDPAAAAAGGRRDYLLMLGVT